MEWKELQNLLKDMSLEEKVGQMVQIPAKVMVSGGIITGPAETVEMTEEMISLVGSILNRTGAKTLKQIQKNFVEKHPHHIPLLIMFDVINGMETIFPIPLAQGCTFSPKLVEKMAKVTAEEAAARGVHVTFSPMLDLVRDARWGRVMESTGEDPWLNAELGKAMVRGYQGGSKISGDNLDLKREGNIAGCLKHFAAYGAPEGGREYDNVEISERSLREDYLPAYQAAVEEGCAMVMSSFNTWNRIPSSGNRWLMRKVLREEMGFDGVLISDYAAIEEMICHGIAEDGKEAAKHAIEAGMDIDMVSSAYIKHLAELVRSGEVLESLVDEAVMRILKLKNDLGLFENPYKDASEEMERLLLACDEHRALAREAAAASFVLLKNEEILPLEKESEEKLAFIGPHVDNAQIYGSWSFPEKPEGTVTVKQGVEQKKNGCMYESGCPVMEKGAVTRSGYREDYSGINLEQMENAALEAAKKADKVVLCLGEHSGQTGECASKASLRLPQQQLDLLRKVHRVNSNIVTVIFSGRPVELKEILEKSKAVIMVWMPGTEGGNAIADVLFGDHVPEGKLAITLPRSVGQVPIYYNCFMTGRPNRDGNSPGFVNGYLDETTKPLYPFGYGLSYTKFEISDVTLSAKCMGKDDILRAKVTVKNTGQYVGTETVQMYLRDVKGSVVRPVKMLRGVEKVTLKPGESCEVSFEINEKMLRFYNIDMNYVSESGEFWVYIGSDSSTEKKEGFLLQI